jgi:ankyrin repeat protein
MPSLTLAAAGGHLETLRCLLEAGAAVNGPPGTRITPLAFAIRRGADAAVRLLLEAGADPARADAPAPGNLA